MPEPAAAGAVGAAGRADGPGDGDAGAGAGGTAGRRPAAVAGFLNDRQRRADEYWRDQFAPVVGPPAGAVVGVGP